MVCTSSMLVILALTLVACLRECVREEAGRDGGKEAGRQGGWDGGRHDDLDRRTDKCIAKSKHVFIPCLCVCTHTLYTLSTPPYPAHTNTNLNPRGYASARREGLWCRASCGGTESTARPFALHRPAAFAVLYCVHDVLLYLD